MMSVVISLKEYYHKFNKKETIMVIFDTLYLNYEGKTHVKESKANLFIICNLITCLEKETMMWYN